MRYLYDAARKALEVASKDDNGKKYFDILQSAVTRFEREYQPQVEPTESNSVLAIIVEGGMISAIVTNDEGARVAFADVIVIDYDTDGAAEDDVIGIPQSDGSISKGYVAEWEIDPAQIGLDWIVRGIKAGNK